MENSRKSEVNGMCIAGLVFSILAVLTSWTVILAPLNAGMAFTLACLSGGKLKMNAVSVISCVLASLSLVLAVLIFLAAFFLFIDPPTALYGVFMTGSAETVCGYSHPAGTVFTDMLNASVFMIM